MKKPTSKRTKTFFCLWCVLTLCVTMLGTTAFAANGDPITVVNNLSDFIFSAIGEEMGVLFSVLLILLYLFTALHIIRYSARVKSKFHQLLLFGFAVCFAVQVFVTIGGGTRLIPLTGVTLPLISMGGSSLSTTLIMFAIIQSIYVKEFDYKNLSREKVQDLEEEEDEESLYEYLEEEAYDDHEEEDASKEYYEDDYEFEEAYEDDDTDGEEEDRKDSSSGDLFDPDEVDMNELQRMIEDFDLEERKNESNEENEENE